MSILTYGLVIKSFVCFDCHFWVCMLERPLSMGYIYIHTILYIYMNRVFCLLKS